MNDELDELWGANPHTRTLIWNVENLDDPKLIGSFYSSEESTDHNIYIRLVTIMNCHGYHYETHAKSFCIIIKV